MAGIAAQSVGGGAGGFARATSTTAFGGSARAVGGSGGAGGSGSKITVLNSGSVGTVEINSAGILAQPIGGGGTAVAVGWVKLGGGESGSDARPVWLSSNAPITTYGHHSPGIIAQSVGGGGIVLSGGSGVWGTTFVRGTGHGGDVTVSVNAPITTYGGWSDGVIAQSVHGGGIVFDGANRVVQGAGDGPGG